jgi:hypothetical protein
VKIVRRKLTSHRIFFLPLTKYGLAFCFSKMSLCMISRTLSMNSLVKIVNNKNRILKLFPLSLPKPFILQPLIFYFDYYSFLNIQFFSVHHLKCDGKNLTWDSMHNKIISWDSYIITVFVLTTVLLLLCYKFVLCFLDHASHSLFIKHVQSMNVSEEERAKFIF